MDQLIKRVLGYLNYNDKASLLITYFIKCDRIEKEYLNIIRDYNGNEKLDYAKFINDLNMSRLNIEIINSVNIVYGYKTEIIILLMNNKNYKLALQCASLTKNNKLIENILSLISKNDLLDILNSKQEYIEYLYKNQSFIHKVTAYQLTDYLNIVYIYNLLKKKQKNTNLINLYLVTFTNTQVKEIIKFINAKKSNKELIDMFYNNQHTRNMILNDPEIYNLIKSKLSEDDRKYFEKLFGNNNDDSLAA